MSKNNPKNAGRPTDYPKDLKLKKLQRTIPDVCESRIIGLIDRITKRYKTKKVKKMSSDYLDQPNSPTQQTQEPIDYCYQLNFDGDVFDFDKQIWDYDDICEKLKEMIKQGDSFNVCKIERIATNYEIDAEPLFILDAIEYQKKVIRYFELYTSPLDKTSDEIVEMNEIVKYLTFKID